MTTLLLGAILQSFIWKWQHNVITFGMQLFWLGLDSVPSSSNSLKTQYWCPSFEVTNRVSVSVFLGEIKLVCQTSNLCFCVVKCGCCLISWRPRDERKVLPLSYITRKNVLFLIGKRKFYFARRTNGLCLMWQKPCNQKVHTHRLLSKFNVNNTFPLKRLIKIIVGQ